MQETPGLGREPPRLRIDRIAARQSMPALADPILNRPAEGIGRHHRGGESERALGDAAEDGALDAAVAVATIDRGADHGAKQIGHRSASFASGQKIIFRIPLITSSPISAKMPTIHSTIFIAHSPSRL